MRLGMTTLCFLVAAVYAAAAEPLSEENEAPSGISLVQSNAWRSFFKQRKLVNISAVKHPPPMMILQRGCTCSSTVMQYARDLLQDQGLPLYTTSIKELLRPIRLEDLPWYQQGDELVDTVNRGFEEVERDGLGLVFNSFRMSDADNRTELNDILRSHNTRTVIVHRQNALDTLVCEVRDCFKGKDDAPRGYPVDLSGNPNDLCFLRRGADGGGVKTKAVLDLDHMMEHLRGAMDYPLEEAVKVEENGFRRALVIYAEELLGHEYSADNLATSIDAWRRFLKSFGFLPDMAKLTAFLSKRVGTYTPPESHAESIWNLEEVREKIRQDDDSLSWMLRT
mmetsp:Transcript_729/g.1741  ORF Transcript_729/g.1741 Transcript_729/m.1741 type:complete len:337 (+) Transcript_729:73-1083(+)|eukprot:CAMPEP_0170591994 /NCGR_PEP_ID=MMETSP0224-20130122/12698_1 /TAXON_ID=285029 /ORGANISM="Togula jolla, Strain CCCM 725" /LENGTH=336 /DNA_ID=CAMNT_0010915891 /DNA_START=69 /DNA_END=1079 /DNA_ORIENTATION=+